MTQDCTCHGSGGPLSQTVSAKLTRPRYSPGLILEDRDLTAAVDYTRDLNRLLFRNLFGCGVICGLTVTVETGCGLEVTVGPGLALDGCGDPVELPHPVKIAVPEDKQRQWEDGTGSRFWVILCGAEKLCEPRALVCEDDDFDGAAQATRIRALTQVSISSTEPQCVCGCRPRAAAAPKQTGKGAAPVSAVDCQSEHETRDDCAPDCGCGTACDCGCCVLLAEAVWDGTVWTVRHRDVRRLVRPKLIDDHEPKTSEAAAVIAYDAKTGKGLSQKAFNARVLKYPKLDELGLSKVP